jgi:transcriptional regulator with XRE-family HTH domain
LFHDTIREKVAQVGITLQEIADLISVNKSTISKFLKGEHELKFELLHQLISSLFPLDEQSKAFRETFLHLNNKRNIKCSLEYFYANRDMESLETLIKQKKEISKGDLKELIYLYEIGLSLRKNSDQCTIKKLTEFIPSNNESKLVHLIILLFFYTHERVYKLIVNEFEHANSLLSLIEDGYFKESLQNNVLWVFLNYHAYNNNQDEVFKILDELNKRKTNHFIMGFCLHTKAMHYMWDNFKESYECYLDCIDFYSKIGSKEHVNYVKYEGLYLLIIHANKNYLIKDIENAPDFIKSYYYFKEGDAQKSRILLDECKTRIIEQNALDLLPYQFYIEGVLTEDNNYFWLSLYQFFAEGDLYNAKLPLMELKKTGLTDELIEHMMDIERKKMLVHVFSPALS